MKMTFDDTSRLIDNFNQGKHIAFWDGWNAVLGTENPAVWFKPDGRFIKGKWYRTYIASPDEMGRYEIPARYARRR
jgi:hypothetical protein